MKSPLVSIIIPIYNGERYIDTCINMLLRQTYENIEIICVPNNCTDNSIELLNKWALKDNRVKIFQNSIKGTSFARKRGIVEAKGVYTLFFDVDDKYVSKNAVKSMVFGIQNDKTDICQFDYIVQYPIPFLRRRIRVVESNKIYNSDSIFNGDPFFGATQGRGKNFNISLCCKIFKTELLKEVVDRIKTPMVCGDDTELELFVFSNSCLQAVSCRKEAYYIYRVGRGITAKEDSILRLMRDYKLLKLEIYNEYKVKNVPDYFMNNLFSEALYCFRDAVYSCIYRKLDYAEILSVIEEFNSFEYIKLAKVFFRKKIKNGWLETTEASKYLMQAEHENNLEQFIFMCSEYTSKEYFDWCMENLPKRNLLTIIKKIIRKFV